MIRSFRCKDTEKIFHGQNSRKFPAIEKVAIRKLFILDSAGRLEDLRSPGSSLELLTKERKGQYAVRINDMYRLCFVWEDGNAHQVEIVDYH